MAASSRKSSWLTGALVGALFTPSLMAVMFIGERFSQLPYLPFDFFNWVARVLPGPIITFGIDSMVDLLLLLGLGGNLDEAAKTAEQLMALVTFWIIGVIATALFFFVRNRLRIGANLLAGAAFGALLLLPFMLISLDVNVSSPQPVAVQLVWFILLYLGFGAAVDWAWGATASTKRDAGAEAEDASVNKMARREFMVRLGGASATITVLGAGLGALLNTTDGEGAPTSSSTALASGDVPTDGSGNPLPNANDPVTPAPGTRPEYTPVEDHYRIDILSGGLPTIPEDYTLPITGLVANEVEWSLEDIRAMPSISEFITMSCISNRIAGSLISTTKWTGVSMQHILEQIDPSEEAVALKIVGADDFDEYLDLELIRNDERIMLAYDFDDQPLPLRNGFPLRIHIPDRYGMKQPKWILSIEVVEEHEPGYWVRRGWSADAIVNTTSVIDTVAVDDVYSDSDGQQFVPIGGMAWAGDRAIVGVQVRVNDGEWQDAELRAPLSGRAWTIWRYDWPFEEGRFDFTVRTFEAAPEGQSDPLMQTSDRSGTRPDGATGWHSVDEQVSLPEPEEEEAPAEA